MLTNTSLRVPTLLNTKEFRAIRRMLLTPVIFFYSEMLETITNVAGEPELVLKDYHRTWQAIAKSKANIYGELTNSEQTYLELWLAHRDKLDARQRKFLLLMYRKQMYPDEIARRYGMRAGLVKELVNHAVELLLSKLYTASSDVSGAAYEAYRLTLETMPDKPLSWRLNLPARGLEARG